jgi:hypothetical protein
VLWTIYKKNLDIYQGALENKETYSKAFLRLTAETLEAGKYDNRKIESVLDSLIAECTAIASARWDPSEVEMRDFY